MVEKVEEKHWVWEGVSIHRHCQMVQDWDLLLKCYSVHLLCTAQIFHKVPGIQNLISLFLKQGVCSCLNSCQKKKDVHWCLNSNKKWVIKELCLLKKDWVVKNWTNVVQNRTHVFQHVIQQPLCFQLWFNVEIDNIKQVNKRRLEYSRAS